MARVIEAAQFDVPVGSFGAEELDVLVRADATMVEPAEIERLMVGDQVRLGDLAQVYFAPATPESIARVDGRLVLSLGIVRQAHSDTVRISEQVQWAVARLERRFPDLSFAVTSDDAIFIRGAIREVLKTLGLALCIVMGEIWLFVGRLGATLVPAAAIPVAQSVRSGRFGCSASRST